ncbi:polyadenylate-binding protein-interacting protein 6-like isoform X1 [Typha latifolia]|uniref:polyadenylate-binding protein-interacting protein 6-like isoform X1 n=2 Tax=Typha latifolia TaxID=4733 RepID=UPI003C2D71FB
MNVDYRSGHSNTTMEGKSRLNPYAKPYEPLSKVLCGKSIEQENKAAEKVVEESGNNEAAGKSTELELPDSISVDYCLQSLDKNSTTGESSLKLDHPYIFDNTFHDQMSIMDDPNLMVESLLSMFPGISVDSITALLNANNCDLDQTIDMLEQLEFDGDGFDDLSGASDASSHLGPDSQQVMPNSNTDSV